MQSEAGRRSELEERLTGNELNAVVNLAHAKSFLIEAEQFLLSVETQCESCNLNRHEPHNHWVSQTSIRSAITRVNRALDSFGAGWAKSKDFGFAGSHVTRDLNQPGTK